jgi:hypothetical protein
VANFSLTSIAKAGNVVGNYHMNSGGLNFDLVALGTNIVNLAGTLLPNVSALITTAIATLTSANVSAVATSLASAQAVATSANVVPVADIVACFNATNVTTVSQAQSMFAGLAKHLASGVGGLKA